MYTCDIQLGLPGLDLFPLLQEEKSCIYYIICVIFLYCRFLMRFVGGDHTVNLQRPLYHIPYMKLSTNYSRELRILTGKLWSPGPWVSMHQVANNQGVTDSSFYSSVL